MKMIESPCQTLQKLNNLFSYLENNPYQCRNIALDKLSFQKFKKFPIPQPFIDRESEYLQTIKHQPKQNIQNKPDLMFPDFSKNQESLKEFTSYVSNIRSLRKSRKYGQNNVSAINFKSKKDVPNLALKFFRQNSTHQVQVGKRRNAKVESPSPRQQNKHSNWAKDFFQKLDNESFRVVLNKQNKNEQLNWNIYHKKSYDKKIYDLELRPQTQNAIKQFQQSLLEKIQ